MRCLQCRRPGMIVDSAVYQLSNPPSPSPIWVIPPISRSYVVGGSREDVATRENSKILSISKRDPQPISRPGLIMERFLLRILFRETPTIPWFLSEDVRFPRQQSDIWWMPFTLHSRERESRPLGLTLFVRRRRRAEKVYEPYEKERWKRGDSSSFLQQFQEISRETSTTRNKSETEEEEEDHYWRKGDTCI